MICLPEQYANAFLKALKSGKINPERLIKMTSEQRREFFAKLVGDHAKFVNAEFESKLLLKNQKRGLVTWAERMSGLREYSKKDIIEKINKLDRALNPAEQEQFLQDIAEKRLGVQVSYDDAQKLVKLTQKVESLKKPNLEEYQQGDDYWKAKQELIKFARELKADIPPTIGKFSVARKRLADYISVQRALKVGFDLSAPLRQGRALLGTREWNGAFRRMFQYAKDPTAMDELEIKMMRNKYADAVLSVKRELGLTSLGETFTQREEDFASKLVDKIPVLRGSERAFVGFLNDLRFNRFVNIVDRLEKKGFKITEDKEALKNLAKVIGAATGRGSLGSAEGAARSLATVLFSPRWIASRVQLLLNPITKTGPARQEAIRSLATLAGTSAAILGMAKMAGVDVEIDPRSSDFGKIKIGNVRFDITGGLATYITLMSRLATLSSKSSTTGVITALNSGAYNSRTAYDVALSFITNKTAPLPSLVRDFLKGKTWEGQKLDPTDTSSKNMKFLAKYLGKELFEPLLASDALDAYQDSSGNVLLTAGAFTGSLFGAGVVSYKGSIKQQVKELYRDNEDEEAKQLLENAYTAGKISKFSYERLKKQLKQATSNKEIDLPNDIVYFKSLPYEYQLRRLKKMKLEDVNRYAWYAKKELKSKFSSISKNTAEFVKLYHQGKVKHPIWKRQKNETR